MKKLKRFVVVLSRDLWERIKLLIACSLGAVVIMAVLWCISSAIGFVASLCSSTLATLPCDSEMVETIGHPCAIGLLFIIGAMVLGIIGGGVVRLVNWLRNLWKQA